MRPDGRRPARRRGRSEAAPHGRERYPSTASRGSGSRRATARCVCPVGKASPAATGPASELSSQSAHAVRAGSASQRTAVPAGTAANGAATVGEAEEVVEVLVDVLGLPLAVDGPDPLGDGVVVAVAVDDGSVEAIAQRPDEIGASVSRTGARAVVGVGDASRRRCRRRRRRTAAPARRRSTSA